MKINVGSVPDSLKERGPKVGDVYKMRGGRFGSERFHIIMAFSESGETAYCLCFDEQGRITGVTQYGWHYMDRRECVGAADIPDLSIRWLAP